MANFISVKLTLSQILTQAQKNIGALEAASNTTGPDEHQET